MISICLATYNGEKYIEEQLEAIYTQTIPVDEVIICDDNSNDATRTIINEFIKKKKIEYKWKLIHNPERKGYPSNFYYCMQKCSGDIIFFADQDDLWHNAKVESMVNIMKSNGNIKLLSCAYSVMDETGVKIENIMTPKNKENKEIKKVGIEEILKKFNFPGMTMAIDKIFYKENLDFFINSDIPHDFMLAILGADREVFYSFDYVGVYHRRHSNNAANEEHRVNKLLNLKRKLWEINKYEQMLDNVYLLNIDKYFSTSSKKLILEKRNFIHNRFCSLKNRDLGKSFKNYYFYKQFFSIKSFIGDVWLILFTF